MLTGTAGTGKSGIDPTDDPAESRLDTVPGVIDPGVPKFGSQYFGCCCISFRPYCCELTSCSPNPDGTYFGLGGL